MSKTVSHDNREYVGKHILFLTHYFPPEVNAPASRTYEHARRWVKTGVKVTVITNNPNHPHGKLFEGYQNRFHTRETFEGINVLRVKTFLTPNAGFMKRIVNYLFYSLMAVISAFRVKDVNVVIATSPQFFCGVAGVLISKIKRKPFILEVRDLWPESVIALKLIKNRALIRLLRSIERRMYSAARAIVTTTDAIGEYIVETGYPGEQIFTIYNSVDLEMFDVNKPIKKDYELFNSKFLVSYAGTFGRSQGVETILAASKSMENYDDILFLLIGGGEESEKIIKMSKELNLKNLIILPLQPKDKIADFISMSDLGIIVLRDIPLLRTAIPSKMFEYLAMKKPVIYSTGRVEGAALVEKYECGLVVKPEDSDELKDAIIKLYSDKNMRNRFGENGFRAVKQFFNRDIMAEKMLKRIFTSTELA